MKSNHDTFRTERIHEHLNNPDFSAWYVEMTGKPPSGNNGIEKSIEAFVMRNCVDECPVVIDIEPATWMRCQHDRKVWAYRDDEFRQRACPKLVEYEERKGQARIDTLLAEAQIPKLYQSLSLGTFKPLVESQRVALEIIFGYLEHFVAGEFSGNPTGLYLCGPVGVGKTHLAVSALKEVCLRGTHGYFARISNVLHRLRPPVTDDELFDKLETIDFLVLDDLGAQKDSAWTLEVLTEIIEARLVGMLPTVITSNLTLEMLAGGGLECSRIASRIKQMCDVVLVRGDDYRETIARERRRR